MGNKSVTREQFDEAVKKANEDFVDMTLSKKETPEGAMTVLIMGLQNAAFATLIEKHLFGEEPIKEDTTIEE